MLVKPYVSKHFDKCALSNKLIVELYSSDVVKQKKRAQGYQPYAPY